MKPPLPDLTDEEEEYEQAKRAEYIENCISGSSELKDAILMAFKAFEAKHNLKEGEGKILLLDTGIKK